MLRALVPVLRTLFPTVIPVNVWRPKWDRSHSLVQEIVPLLNRSPYLLNGISAGDGTIDKLTNALSESNSRLLLMIDDFDALPLDDPPDDPFLLEFVA